MNTISVYYSKNVITNLCHIKRHCLLYTYFQFNKHEYADNMAKYKKIILKDGLPLTTKNDHNSHGYGMKSIRYIVEKYNGNLIIDCNNNIFVLSILLSKNK